MGKSVFRTGNDAAIVAKNISTTVHEICIGTTPFQIQVSKGKFALHFKIAKSSDLQKRSIGTRLTNICLITLPMQETDPMEKRIANRNFLAASI